MRLAWAVVILDQLPLCSQVPSLKLPTNVVVLSAEMWLATELVSLDQPLLYFQVPVSKVA